MFVYVEVISSFRSLRTGSQVFAILMLFICVILHTMWSGKSLQFLCILPFGILCLSAIRMMFVEIILAVCILVDIEVREKADSVSLCGVVCNLLSHSLHCMILGENSVSFTLRKKQFLDFSLLSAGCFPYREWVSLVSCLVFSILAHTSLRMSGGAIPVSKYRSSTLVGFRHPVMALHSMFSSVFSFWACGDLTQPGAAYSAIQ